MPLIVMCRSNSINYKLLFSNYPFFFDFYYLIIIYSKINYKTPKIAIVKNNIFKTIIIGKR